ncbi:hypothetical protein TrRE_jg8645 [Triparma retinervis]|uniref:Fumarylacetoacetase n=1 Tax=Triparma retinervis TaxID=2557542 RepID=A0A9W6ZVB6_9STRA|nr:hypothetical protein TrRE_jg8645 [Triparma retinervis]
MSTIVPPAVPSATLDHQFSLQNLPYGIFSTAEIQPTVGVAIGDFVVHLKNISDLLLNEVEGLTIEDIDSATLNSLMSKPSTTWKSLRACLTKHLSTPAFPTSSLVPLTSVTMHMPAKIGDYTDFYSSREHATNVGIMFRGVDNALQPNWLHLPVGYHGRASSVYLSGTDVVRPRGQLQISKDDPKQGSQHGPCKLMDFELEMAFFVGGPPSPPATPITMAEAEDRIFGLVLMNDWSARDIQKWEYVPLGPFGAKNFATTISPWVVSLAALEPYRAETSAGPVQTNPSPLEYITDPNYSSYDIALSVSIQGPSMSSPAPVSRSNFRNLYWNVKQQLVHHSVTGCNMQPGDLLGSGTISGQDETSYGSMLELCWKGTKEVKLGDTGEVRKFLRDGDTVVMEGGCGGKEGVGRVGFGEVRGKILEAGSKVVKGEGEGVWKQA